MTSQRPRVLFIGPRTFGYENEIKREIELAGYSADWHDERPSSSPLIKALIRVSPQLAAPLSNIYFDRIIRAASKDEHQIVFVIKGEALSVEKIRELRLLMPGARFIYFAWDSLSNVKGSRQKLAYFDRVYSFDRFDCLSEVKIKHLPLFYVSAYENLAPGGSGDAVNQDIDLLLLASVHSDRYSVAQKIFRAARRVMPAVSIYEYLYFQSRWVFALRKLVDPEFRIIPWRAVRWRALNPGETLSLVARSRILVDVHHPKQTGLTMRMLEGVGAGKKVITTNPDVKYYDFYRPENILVVDRDNPEIPADFILQPYQPLAPEVYRRYSLRRWLKEILSVAGEHESVQSNESGSGLEK